MKIHAIPFLVREEPHPNGWDIRYIAYFAEDIGPDGQPITDSILSMPGRSPLEAIAALCARVEEEYV